MKARQVHEGISCKEEVGCDNAYGVETCHHHTPHGNQEYKYVAPPWVIVCIEAFLEPIYARVDAIFAHSLMV